ncbi:MAG: alpha/beta hydrolase [Clostridia bacterium]
MSISKRKSIIFILVLFLAAAMLLSLTACKDKVEVAGVRVESDDEMLPVDFSIENSAVVISYSDGNQERIPITKDMLSDEDKTKLSHSGRHNITVNYDKNKSIDTQIHLLKPAANTALILDKLVAGLQKAVPQNNINGEFETTVNLQIGSGERKEYRLVLKFTLDIDQNEGAENYLEIALYDGKELLMGAFYKDNTDERPYFHIKLDAREFMWWMGPWEGKYLTTSVDDIFGTASYPADYELLPFFATVNNLMSYVMDNNKIAMINMVFSFLLSNPEVAEDGSVAALTINFDALIKWLPFAGLIPGVSSTVTDFLGSMGINASFSDLAKNISSDINPRLKLRFGAQGDLQDLDISGNYTSQDMPRSLKVSLQDNLDMGVTINKLSLKINSSSFSLPTHLGIEDWEEGSVKGVEEFWEQSIPESGDEDAKPSLERWMMLQYRKMMGGPPSETWYEDITQYRDISYTDSDTRFNKMDIYRPKDEADGDTLNKLPVIVSIHGGGWVNGNKEFNHIYCQDLARQGFAVLNINYHLIPVAPMPKPMQDVFAVFNFIDDNAELYGFDRNNVFLTGDSAGGHYAMLVLSILGDPELIDAFGVETKIKINAASVSSTGFTFSEALKFPIPFAHFFVNQFFTDDVPYTAYKDNPDYIKMATALNIENNKIETFPPLFVSTAHADMVLVHSERLIAHMKAKGLIEGVDFVYDYRAMDDLDNPERHILGHNFNVASPEKTVSRAVNKAMCDFFKLYITA